VIIEYRAMAEECFSSGLGAVKKDSRMPDMTPHVLSLQQGDDIALQYLGAAVVLQWEALPEAARDAIWQQAESVGGLPPVTSLHEQLKSLIRRTKS